MIYLKEKKYLVVRLPETYVCLSFIENIEQFLSFTVVVRNLLLCCKNHKQESLQQVEQFVKTVY